MNLKVIEETSTGLNTRFVNQDSGRSVSLEHAVQQIQKGNSNYANYEVVNKANDLSLTEKLKITLNEEENKI